MSNAKIFVPKKPDKSGADGIIGLDYTFKGAPINLSIDWKPAVEIINGDATYPSGFGIAVRYVFK